MGEVIAGVDVGNATTEIAIAEITEGGELIFLKSGIIRTTGTKGTIENVDGVIKLLRQLTADGNSARVQKVLINDATPVIADFAMDTITETIITDSAMIGHNPETPGGVGLGTGLTVKIDEIPKDDKNYIVIVPEGCKFSEAAKIINEAVSEGRKITGAILQKDEGTLVSNRLARTIPIVDEVSGIDRIPLNMPCAVEVAAQGHSVDILSNPYGIASVFHLTPEETDYCRYVSKALIGNRSAVVIKTPASDIKSRVIPAGMIEIEGTRYNRSVKVDSGAEKIMDAVREVKQIVDVKGEPGTNIGGMLETIRMNLSASCHMDRKEIKISDIMAVDSYTAVEIKGGLAGEYAMETGVAIAAMVKTDQSFMDAVARELESRLKVPVSVGGIEGAMAFKGVLTTPGAAPPLVMIDIGAGSTDAAYMDAEGRTRAVHLAGAGNLITMLINSELHLNNYETAEQIKKYPLAKVDNLYRLRYENGDVTFLNEPLPAQYFGQTVTVAENMRLGIVESKAPIEKIRSVRRQAKKKVIIENVKRALERINEGESPHQRVILVGGTVLDFEIGNLLTEEMDKLKITAGKGNIRGTEGPRNAVATGLIKSYYEKKQAD